MQRIRRSLALVAALALVGLLAVEASARGGGMGGGGGRGGSMGGGRMGGGRMGGMGGGMGGFGMRGNRNGTNGKSAKEWEVLQNIEERKKQIAERRERLMDLDRKAQQELYLASWRQQNALAFGGEGNRR